MNQRLQSLISDNERFLQDLIYRQSKLKRLTPSTASRKIHQSLEKNAAQLTASGHGIIMGALAIKAINILNKDLPEDIVSAVQTIITWTEADSPKR